MIFLILPHQCQNECYSQNTAHTLTTFNMLHDMYPMSVWTGTPPDVMFIDCEPLRPLLNEECTLHLCIKDFCPKDVSVTWTKDGEEVLFGVFNTPPSLNINGLYSMFSFLKLTPNKDDQCSELRCRVVHSAQREPEERLFTLPNLHLTDGSWHPYCVYLLCFNLQ